LRSKRHVEGEGGWFGEMGEVNLGPVSPSITGCTGGTGEAIRDRWTYSGGRCRAAVGIVEKHLNLPDGLEGQSEEKKEARKIGKRGGCVTLKRGRFHFTSSFSYLDCG